MPDPMGICGTFYYMDDVFFDIFDSDYPDWEDEIYYNLFGCDLFVFHFTYSYLSNEIFPKSEKVKFIFLSDHLINMNKLLTKMSKIYEESK